MNVLLCDDEPDEIAALKEILSDSDSEVKINCFRRATEALKYIQSGTAVELCFLDIVMPDMTGIQLAKQLRSSGYTGAIVFLSSSNEYGPESYTVNAFSYLLKPPTVESVEDLLTRLKERQSSPDQNELAVHIAGRMVLIPHRTISYIEVVRHTVRIHTNDGREYHVNTTFSAIASRVLTDSRFIQCHRSYIVNMQNIVEISKRELVMLSGARISIPRTYGDTQGKFYKWKFESDQQ